jgi:excisionase family DNA binding protein
MNDVTEQYITPEQARKILNVSVQTLRHWDKQGKITACRTSGGHRRFKLSSILKHADREPTPARRRICYARVSSSTQKKDLETQIDFFRTTFPDYEIIRDMGSGLNFKRKGFLSILDSAMSGTIGEVVVTHRDRLCRFGFEVVEFVLNKNGGRIVVLNDEKLSPEQELVQDLLTITTVFSARLYGLRSHTLKRKIRDSNKKTSQESKQIQVIEDENLSD